MTNFIKLFELEAQPYNHCATHATCNKNETSHFISTFIDVECRAF